MGDHQYQKWLFAGKKAKHGKCIKQNLNAKTECEFSKGTNRNPQVTCQTTPWQEKETKHKTQNIK